MKLIEESTNIERSEDASRSPGWLNVDLGVSKVLKNLAALQAVVMAKIRFLMLRVLEYIVMAWFNCCVFLVFFAQIGVLTILVILGPFSFSASVIPVWSNTWATWVARFFSVSIWSGIAFIILKVVFKIVEYSLDKEIALLKASMEKEGGYAIVAANISGDIMFFIIAALIGSFMMLGIFPIATWIVQTSGGHTPVAAAAGAAVATTSVVTKAVL